MPLPRCLSAPLLSWRWAALCSLVVLLIGCSALPRSDSFSVRPTVTLLGIEDIRIGSYAIRDGLDSRGIASLIASSLGAESLPLQATLNMGLGLPGGLPPLTLDGFTWRLDVPGVEPVKGAYPQSVALTPGEATQLRLPVNFDILGDGHRLASLANQLVKRGGLPAGSELAIIPGGVSSLGIRLPAGLTMPTVRLTVAEDGSLQPQP